MVRKLTKRFGAYTISQWEKKTGKTILGALDIGELEINKIAALVSLGNANMPEEEACDLIDRFMIETGETNLLDLYLQVIEELDADWKVLKMANMSVDQLRKSFAESKSMIENNEETKESSANLTLVKTEEKLEDVNDEETFG